MEFGAEITTSQTGLCWDIGFQSGVNGTPASVGKFDQNTNIWAHCRSLIEGQCGSIIGGHGGSLVLSVLIKLSG